MGSTANVINGLGLVWYSCYRTKAKRHGQSASEGQARARLLGTARDADWQSGGMERKPAMPLTPNRQNRSIARPVIEKIHHRKTTYGLQSNCSLGNDALSTEREGNYMQHIWQHIDSQRGAYAAAKRAKSDATRAHWLAIVAREAAIVAALIEGETK